MSVSFCPSAAETSRRRTTVLVNSQPVIQVSGLCSHLQVNFCWDQQVLEVDLGVQLIYKHTGGGGVNRNLMTGHGAALTSTLLSAVDLSAGSHDLHVSGPKQRGGVICNARLSKSCSCHCEDRTNVGQKGQVGVVVDQQEKVTNEQET